MRMDCTSAVDSECPHRCILVVRHLLKLVLGQLQTVESALRPFTLHILLVLGYADPLFVLFHPP